MSGKIAKPTEFWVNKILIVITMFSGVIGVALEINWLFGVGAFSFFLALFVPLELLFKLTIHKRDSEA